jgi:hypothetical protein
MYPSAVVELICADALIAVAATTACTIIFFFIVMADFSRLWIS